MPTRLRWVLGFALALLAACAPIHYGEQEISLAHASKADTLRMLIVYDAIQSLPRDGKSGDEEASQFAERVSKGRRQFMIFDWPLCFDLEDWLKEAEEGDGAWSAWRRELRGVVASLRVVESGYCAGNDGRLALYQELEIGHASRLVSLLERALYLHLEEAAAEGTFEGDTEIFDSRTRELWIAMARDKRGWLALKDGVLAVDLPLSSAVAARLLADLTKTATADSDGLRFFAGTCSHLSELTLEGEHAVLRWKLSGPTFTFKPPKDADYDGRLAESLAPDR